LTPWSKVTQISASHFASHFAEQTAYISVSRFRIDDLSPYIYRTTDGGKTWKLIVNGLPDSPVNTVREDAERKGLLFAGTENSVWVSFNGGDGWQSLQLNLPHTSMRDLWVHENDLIVATHGRGFWVLDDIAPIRFLSATNASGTTQLVPPPPAYRVRRSTYSDTPVQPDEPAGENPPDGAIIDYFLPASVAGPVTLEILNSKSGIIRRYSSEDKPELTEEDRAKGLIPLYWLQPPRVLSSEAGWHRWVWDLRYAPPVSTEHEYPISAVPHATPRYPLGPLALPDKYTVRLTVNGKPVASEPLVVKMDPRVKTSSAGLIKQLELELKLTSAITESSQAVMQARSAQEQLEKLAATGETKLAAQDLETRISDLLDGSKQAASEKSQRTLKERNSNVISLYKEVEKADAEPTVALLDASSMNTSELAPLLKRWEQLKSGVQQLNVKLSTADLPTIDLNRLPEHEEVGENEE